MGTMKMVKRTEKEFSRIPVPRPDLSELLDGKWMLENRAIFGAKALSAWLHRCRASVGVLKGVIYEAVEGFSGTRVHVRMGLRFGDVEDIQCRWSKYSYEQ